MLDNKAALHSQRNFWDTGSEEKPHHSSPWGCFWAGAEEESKAAAVSEALGYQRSDWECKEGEVNPAHKKTAYCSRASVFTYPLELRVDPPHAQGLIPGPRNQLVIFTAWREQKQSETPWKTETVSALCLV